ncbi:MAG: TrkA family potassium uptake protein [Lachnospiraceae bacterium]|nr:TrkA family potassium uptake protein [Lachnospiraceae bacterium]
MKKSIAVLGLGNYGRSLAETLFNLGADVLAVDINEELINDFAGKCTSAICANLQNEDEVAALGLKNMDVVVIAMGDSLAPSIMATVVAKEKGVPLVVAKTSSERMSSILKKVGADKIIDPESEGGERSARILLSSGFKDYFRIDDNMYMVEIYPEKDWIGKNLIELELRKRIHINVVAVRDKGKFWHFVDPHKPLTEDVVILAAMEKDHMEHVRIKGLDAF